MDATTLKVPDTVTLAGSPEPDANRILLYQRQLREQRCKAVERLELATAAFGLTYSQAEISRRVEQTLPRRPFRERTARWTQLGDYRQPIPDLALARYAEAMKTGFFGDFAVVEARYRAREVVPADPWLVGQVGDADRWIVLAYWD